MKLLLLATSFLWLLAVQAQVGIGTNSPNTSAVLDLSSTSKGLLVPRMTTVQRTGIAAPVNGLLVYDTDADNFYFHNGSAWVQAVGPAGTNGTNGKTILSGTTFPAAGIGTDGDFYLRTTNNQFYGPKAAGAWGSGISLVGPAGTNGTDGTDGTNGKTILSGTTFPAAGIGTDGDFYLRTTNNQFYGPKAAGAWGSGVSLVGPAGTNGTDGTNGTNGKTILSGTTTPAAGIGTDGDFYLRTTNNQFYGPKAAGAWGSGVSLVGPAGTNGTNGTNGKTILSGTTIPAAGLGTDGDFYLRTTNNQFYGPKAAGAWGSGVSLIGPQGAAGGTNHFVITSNILATLPSSATWAMFSSTNVSLNTSGVLLNVSISISTATLNNQEVICNLCYGTSALGPFIPITAGGGGDVELSQRLGTTYQIIALAGKLAPASPGIYWVGPCYKISTDNLQIKGVTGYGIILE